MPVHRRNNDLMQAWVRSSTYGGTSFLLCSQHQPHRTSISPQSRMVVAKSHVHLRSILRTVPCLVSASSTLLARPADRTLSFWFAGECTALHATSRA